MSGTHRDIKITNVTDVVEVPPDDESMSDNESKIEDDDIMYSFYDDDSFIFKINEDGKYDHLDLPYEERQKFIRVPLGRIVWETFYGRVPEGYVVEHIDGHRCNNRLDNLRMVPITEDNKHLGELKPLRFDQIRKPNKNFIEQLSPHR